MLEFVRQYRKLVAAGRGPAYAARAYAAQSPTGAWEAWFAFFPVNEGPIVTSGPETFAETLEALDLWTQRISSLDLRTALERALDATNTPRHHHARHHAHRS